MAPEIRHISGIVALAMVCATLVMLSFVISSNQLVMYEEFNRQYLAAQVLEAELQHRYNDANVTIKIYEPPAGLVNMGVF